LVGLLSENNFIPEPLLSSPTTNKRDGEVLELASVDWRTLSTAVIWAATHALASTEPLPQISSPLRE